MNLLDELFTVKHCFVFAFCCFGFLFRYFNFCNLQMLPIFIFFCMLEFKISDVWIVQVLATIVRSLSRAPLKSYNHGGWTTSPLLYCQVKFILLQTFFNWVIKAHKKNLWTETKKILWNVKLFMSHSVITWKSIKWKLNTIKRYD